VNKAGMWIAVVALGCTAHAAEPVLAKAGAIELDAAQVRTLIAALPEATRTALAKNPASLEQVVRSEVIDRAVLAEAKSGDFARQPETVSALARISDEALVKLYVSSKAIPPPDYPRDELLDKAYEASKAQLRTPADYHLAQIFLPAPDASEPEKLGQALRRVSELAPKLAAGADFAQLARDNSGDPESAARGGDMGWLAEDKLMPEVRTAIRDQKTGTVVGPIKTSAGFHYIKILEKKDGRALSLAEARDTLVSALRARRAQELQQQYLQELGARLNVSVNQIELGKLKVAAAK